MPKGSLRLERAEISRLVRAFAISLALHLLVVGGYYGGKQLGWWQNWRSPAWMQSVKMLTDLLKLKKAPTPEPPPPREPPLMFVQVNPAASIPEPPKNAAFYSDKNARAANPDPKEDTGVPRIAGEQKEVVKTEDTSRNEFKPLQPSLPAPRDQTAQEELKPKPAQPVGDLTMAKPEPVQRQSEGQETRSRPRTIKEALARQGQIPGRMMKQEGGVRARLEISSMDTKATPFGAYDAALIEAIAQRWYSLLDQRAYASDSRGKVVLHFVLHYDGRVSEMSVAENSAGEVLGLLCEKSVRDPAPFAAWPIEMRRLMGDTRKIQFTFYYN